ncbi:MAG: UDP-N-acetylglucosamine--N-acetylmuramyl-(pentapeptide) pyrophosphoryl-undecaprenol N-acetylglucosamine transferase [Planctomycetota bacterium]
MSENAAIGVVLAGGGTGGHIQPNLAIASALERLRPGACRFVFVVSDRPIDRRVIEGASIAGEPVRAIISPANPLAANPLRAARFALRWGGGVRAGRDAARALRRECGRVVMVATGGFVSAPAVMGARAERVGRIVINLDAVPGKANRLASRFATETLSVGDGLRPIVGAAWSDPPTPQDARRSFGLDPSTRTLLVTGGSQGARSVNRFVLAAFRDLAGRSSWQVVHQTGDGEHEACAAAWSDLGVSAFVAPYIDGMERAFAAADAVVCRGGAGTIADLWASRRPAVVLPYPYHRDRHQARNAEPLRSAGGVIIADDLVDPARNTRAHAESLGLLLDDARRAAMASAMASLGPADGARQVADRVLRG